MIFIRNKSGIKFNWRAGGQFAYHFVESGHPSLNIKQRLAVNLTKYLGTIAHTLGDFLDFPSDTLSYSPCWGGDDRHVIGVDGSLLKLSGNADHLHLAPVYSPPTASLTESTGGSCLLNAFLSSFDEAEALKDGAGPQLEGKRRHNTVVSGICGLHPLSTSCFTITTN